MIDGDAFSKSASHSISEPPADSIRRLRALLQRRERAHIAGSGAREAAVLVPIVAAARGLELLCFMRTTTVLEHKGEICFPGGAVELDDADAVSAALREAEEELGIEPRDVDVVGMLDDVLTSVSNYVIVPVVGFIAQPRELVLDPREVARPIHAPLLELARRGSDKLEVRGPDGATRHVYSYDVGADRIWGATARIIHNLLALWGESGTMQ
jgi:8-oxo-dGTP pyrophosphatase MutT (NUDIX family)